MPYGAPVAHAAVSDTGTTATSASLTTTGASLLVVAIAYNAGNYPTTPPAVSDSKSNTWHQLTAKLVTGGTRDGVVLYYAFNAIVGTGHTFTVSGGSGINGTFCVAAFPGARTTSDPFDVQNGASSGASDTGVSAGSVTPTLDGELVITAFCIDDPAGSTIACSGYTITDTVDVTVGAQYGLSLAYQIQGSATATNPAWTRTTTNTQSGDAAVVASFAAAPSAATWPVGTRQAPAKAGPFDRLGMLLSPYRQYSYVPSTVAGSVVTMLASGVSSVSTSLSGGFVRNVKASALSAPSESSAAGVIRDFRVRASSGIAARAAAGALRDLRSSGSAGASEKATAGALRGILARGGAAVAASLSAGALRGMKGTGLAVVIGDGVFTNVHGLVQFLARGLTGVRGTASLGVQRALMGSGLSGVRGVWQIGVVRDVRARGVGGVRAALAVGLLRDLRARGLAGVIGSQAVIANGLPPGIGITYLVFDSTVTAVLFNATTGAVIDTVTTSITFDDSIDTLAFDAMIDKQSFQ